MENKDPTEVPSDSDPESEKDVEAILNSFGSGRVSPSGEEFQNNNHVFSVDVDLQDNFPDTEVVVPDSKIQNSNDSSDVLPEPEICVEIETHPIKTSIRKRCCCPCLSCCSRSQRFGSDVHTEANQAQNHDHRKFRSRDCRRCCKRVTTFLFSHVGLCSLVVAYSILGGFIFRELEAPHEKIAKMDVALQRQEQVERLWNLTISNNIFDPSNWTYEADRVLRTFQDQIYRATKEKGWGGSDDLTQEMQWSFAGSLLYSVTVITTIGYGHIAPKTVYGRLVTMVYALFGIPLTLLCLANLGSFLGDCFRLLYKHICLVIMWLCCPTQARWQNTYRTRMKNVKPSETQPLNTKSNDPPGKTAEKQGTLTKNGAKSENQGQVGNTTKDGEVTQKAEVVRVPILVSLMVIVLYIISGAVLFSTWEQNWDYLEGSYFCFITLSTIGFGDFVPGASTYSLSNQEKLILCSLYLIFGLSLIAMCFNLMQEEVVAKCRWMGRKLGIIEDAT